MIKHSINRIFIETNALPYSPLVWDGKDFKLLEEEHYNLLNLKSELQQTIKNLTEDLRLLKIVHSEAEDVYEQAIAAVKKQEEFIEQIGELQDYLYPILQTLINLATRTSKCLTEMQKASAKLADAESSANTIYEGRLITAIGKNAKIELNDNQYILGAKNKTGLLKAANEITSIQYHEALNLYEIGGGNATNSDSVVAGIGLKATPAANKSSSTISVTEFFATSSMGVQNSYNNGIFTFSLQSNLIQAKNDGIVVTRDSIGNFFIDLATPIITAANKTVNFGNGILQNGRTISVDASKLPSVYSASPGVIITKIGTSPDVYKIDFDPSLETLNPTTFSKVKVEAGQNLEVEEISENRYVVRVNKNSTSVDPLLKADAEIRIQHLEEKALDFKTRSQAQISPQDISKGFHSAYHNPLIRLFSFLVGDYEASGLYGTRVAKESKKIEVFGSKGKILSLKTDIVPAILPHTFGPDSAMGSEIEVDLFLLLENRLKELLNDPQFKIEDREKNTYYTLVEVDTTNVTSYFAEQSEFANFSYNTGASLQLLLNYCGDNTILDMLNLTACMTLPQLSNYYSTRFPEMPLQLTLGDIDFVIGYPRFGQQNDKQLVFPANLVPEEKITLVKLDYELDSNDNFVYTIKVLDKYTNQSFNSKWLKKRGKNYNVDRDYMQEVEGGTNPGYIRLFSRLVAGWGYSDIDANRIIYAIGLDSACIAKNCSSIIHDGIIMERLILNDALSDPNQTTHYGFRTKISENSVDYLNGKVRVTITNAFHGLDPTQATINNVLKEVQLRAKFKILPSSASYVDDIMGECWTIDGDVIDSVYEPCNSINSQGYPLPFTNPESNF